MVQKSQPAGPASADQPLRAHVLIIEARFYEGIADMLAEGAIAECAARGVSYERVVVPGALEIPQAFAAAVAATVAGRKTFDGAIVLGCVIRGETTHYDTVCNDSSRAISLLGLQGACIGNGILTVENRPQAVVRADPAGQNKGGGAAAAALHLIALSRKWAGKSKGIGFRA